MSTCYTTRLGVVVEVGFLLGLDLHDALHKVLVVDLQPIPVALTTTLTTTLTNTMQPTRLINQGMLWVKQQQHAHVARCSTATGTTTGTATHTATGTTTGTTTVDPSSSPYLRSASIPASTHTALSCAALKSSVERASSSKLTSGLTFIFREWICVRAVGDAPVMQRALDHSNSHSNWPQQLATATANP